MKQLLTRAERLILMHLFQGIKEIGGTETYDLKSCENFIEILGEGYEYFYDEFLPLDSSIFPLEKSKFVMNILKIYSEIYCVAKEGGANRLMQRSDRFFPGFDGFEERGHYTFCWFAISKMGKFSELHQRLSVIDRELSPAEPMIPKYQRMLAARQAIPSKKITEDQAIAILEA